MFLRSISSFISVALYLSTVHGQLAGQTVQWKSALTTGNGNCITATNNADGAEVVIQDCGANATANNSWLVPDGEGAVGTLQIFGDKCLDVTNGINADGTKLQIWTCASGNTNQMWIPENAGTEPITWSGQNKCIDLTNGNLTNGNQIQIWDCDSTRSNGNQLWNAVPVTLPNSFVISLKKDPSLCVAASANAVNASVVIDTCSPKAVNQTWSDPSNNGQVVIFDNLCMTPTGESIAGGTKIILSPCQDDVGQGWSHETGIINNHNFEKNCLDLTDGIETPGNQLQLWGCTILASTTDNTNQDWIVTNIF